MKKGSANSRFIDIFGFTCNFDFALANEVENVINDEDGTFLDRILVNKEIINSANDKNNDIDHFLSNVMINTEYFFYSVTQCTNSKYFLPYCVSSLSMKNPKVTLKNLFFRYHLV